MAEDMSVITQSIVNLTITSSVNTFGSEKRLQKDLTVADVKTCWSSTSCVPGGVYIDSREPNLTDFLDKLVLLTGSSVANMKLELYTKDNKLVCVVDNDSAMLGSYPVEDGMRLHVVDPTIKLGEFEDVSKVQKYEMTEDDYAKKRDSVRAFKERNKMGRFREIDPEEQKRIDEEKRIKDEEEKQKCESMKLGDRCEVRVQGQPTRRGCVRYAGQTDFKPGHWVGVQYDEPFGKHNGKVGGKQYFECPDKYGAFVRPSCVEVGEFPEEDMDFSDDEM